MRVEKENVVDQLNLSANLEKFAPSYTPEVFTEQEKKYLTPFFSNIDKPVFIVRNLPEEVIGALSAKYSRATESMRRTFLKEYVSPLIHPEESKSWNDLSMPEQEEERVNKESFNNWINFVNQNGGIETIVNVQRSRGFFEKWLVEFGDDSISEMGNIHLCIEGLSNVATKEIEDQRIGISPIEKSSRYVSFAERLPDGYFRYIVPGEIKGTPLEQSYRVIMDELFSTYVDLQVPYLEYIKQLYPKGIDETEASFEKSRSAKRFDDLRDLLSFATLTNLGLSGDGRAYEYLINRLAEHPLGELRYWASEISTELKRVTPSFIRRTETQAGNEIQNYKRDIRMLRDDISRELFRNRPEKKRDGWVKLINYSPEGEIDVLTAFIFAGKYSPNFNEVRKKVAEMSEGERCDIFSRILTQRSLGKFESKREDIRFKKVPRAFENSKYIFELWARGGDYRDLHRHRMLTQERQEFTTRYGYDLEKEVLESPFDRKVETALKMVEPLYEAMFTEFPDAAQYVATFGHIQHWYVNLTAREMYYIGELRTGPQGRPHYREVVQEMAREVMTAHPDLFKGMMIDWNDYSLSRRESEKWTDQRKKELGV